MSAQKASDTGNFNSVDEARAAQTRASIAKSHAIHAAVVEHEASTVKRRATLALAHDVKCWNAHRKREILQTALSYAKSQHEATRRSVDAWSCLRDGYVEPTIFPSAQARRPPPPAPSVDLLAGDDVETTIFAPNGITEEPTIVAVEHRLLKQPTDSTIDSVEIVCPGEPDPILPLVVASPIPEEDESSESGGDHGDIFSFQLTDTPTPQSFGSSVHLGSAIDNSSQSRDSSTSQDFASISRRSVIVDEEKEGEVLSSSMQSLVDGLMNWGGQYDHSQDLALPTGMAASIAMEESGVLSSHSRIA